MVHHPEFFRQGHLFIQDTNKKSKHSYSLLPAAILSHILMIVCSVCLLRSSVHSLAQILLSVSQGRDLWEESQASQISAHRPSRTGKSMILGTMRPSCHV